jgi:tyrosyl-tRNA synthetase
MMPAVEKQMEAIRRRAAEIVPEEELIEKLEASRKSNRPLRVKLGLDPTAPDIHIGNAVPLQTLRTLQNLGHHAILIIGDYTATIGDPSQQNTMRPQLNHDEVMKNAQTYLDQAGKIIDLKEAEILQNGEWFSKMDLAGVIQLAGKLTVARCLERDDFRKRLDEGRPIGVHEMLYPLMQAYDSVKVESDIEIGGTDQIFNILLGRDLQREVGMNPQVAITNPLLEGLDGTRKMSKSLGNYIGINEPADSIYGKAMSIPDELMEKYFRLTTDVPDEKIEELLSGDTHPREAKAALAYALTRRYHDEQSARRAAEEFDRVFQEKKLPSELPTLEIPGEGTVWVVKLLKETGRASSNSQARRLIRQGGVRIGTNMDNLQAIEDPDQDLEIDDGTILNVGKRHFWKIKRG